MSTEWITVCEDGFKAEEEYDSGYLDGFNGLSYVPGESDTYKQGYHAGVTARAEEGY